MRTITSSAEAELLGLIEREEASISVCFSSGPLEEITERLVI